jgi:5'-3' exonuclease
MDGIVWKNVSLLVNDLSKNELILLKTEYESRTKWDKKYWPNTNSKERDDMFMSSPVIFRGEEHYICPDELYWEERYYKTLIHEPYNSKTIKNVSMNYLEGLEWVYKYYTRGCPDWKWKYNYHYPPLLSDLVIHVPHFATDFIKPNKSKPFSSNVQLAYVLPPEQLTLLSKNIREILQTKYKDLYPTKMDFQWAFCRYFWEAHSINTPVKLEMLEELELQFA